MQQMKQPGGVPKEKLIETIFFKISEKPLYDRKAPYDEK